MAINHLVVFEPSGRIKEIHKGRLPQATAAAPLDKALCEGASFQGHYVVIETKEVLIKTPATFSFDQPTFVADGIDTATISGVPAYTLVTWPDGEVTEINDGLLEFTVDLAGIYTFTIDSVQHLKQEVTIEALATA